MKRGIQGVFFPVKQATLEHHMLDVNKIHFILASVLNKLQLVEEIDRFVRDREGEEALYQYKQKSIYHDEWDSSDICYIKRCYNF